LVLLSFFLFSDLPMIIFPFTVYRCFISMVIQPLASISFVFSQNSGFACLFAHLTTSGFLFALFFSFILYLYLLHCYLITFHFSLGLDIWGFTFYFWDYGDSITTSRLQTENDGLVLNFFLDKYTLFSPFLDTLFVVRKFLSLCVCMCDQVLQLGANGGFGSYRYYRCLSSRNTVRPYGEI